uniref:Uncharacterized protein n=1 Tax=Brassica oleracea TaxID=3712 RepID=A0A3P6AYP1_BRAOL|nr:unnamed protein product [Brassica oleracea]
MMLRPRFDSKKASEDISDKLLVVPPRPELGLLDSESNVLTARPWNLFGFGIVTLMGAESMIPTLDLTSDVTRGRRIRIL